MPLRFGFYTGTILPSGKLTWQWKMGLLKMYSLLKMGSFYWHVGLLECSYFSWSIALCGGLYDGISMMVEAPFPLNSFKNCHFCFSNFSPSSKTCMFNLFQSLFSGNPSNQMWIFHIFWPSPPSIWLYLSTTFIYGRLIWYTKFHQCFNPRFDPVENISTSSARTSLSVKGFGLQVCWSLRRCWVGFWRFPEIHKTQKETGKWDQNDRDVYVFLKMCIHVYSRYILYIHILIY